ncbi:MAG: hypothetical protein ABJB34_13115 [Acidobacteriota bacterium]
MHLPPGFSYVTAVRVDGGPDVADVYVAEHAEAGDSSPSTASLSWAVTAFAPTTRRAVESWKMWCPLRERRMR